LREGWVEGFSKRVLEILLDDIGDITAAMCQSNQFKALTFFCGLIKASTNNPSSRYHIKQDFELRV